MKKMLGMGLLVLLLLTGCGQQETEATTLTTEPTTVATEATGLYLPESSLEEKTEGAVRAYGLQGQLYDWVHAMGGDVVLAKTAGETELVMLTGEDGVISATAQMPFPVDITSDGTGCQDIYGGYAFYDGENGQMVYLDTQLAEVDRNQLPEQMQGKPACSPDGRQIYYCVGEEVRCLDVDRGISRLVKSHSCKEQMLLGVYMEGKVVACRVIYADGKSAVVYFSAEDGQTMSSQNDEAKLFTDKNTYLLLRKDGVVPQKVFGSDSESPRLLNIEDERIFPVLELQAVLGCTKTDNGTQLSLYSLLDGVKRSALSLEGVSEVKSAAADSIHSVVWLLVRSTDGEDQLLRWDVAASEVEDGGNYAGVLHTYDNPDKDTLKTVQKRADAISREHGVTIRIMEEATKRNNGMQMKVEYQPEAINYVLDELEQAFAMFPDNFLYKSVATRIRICIVRSIDGPDDCVRFWFDGDAYIILTPGGEVGKSFVKAVSYVVESHILGNSPLVDTWTSMNPQGFVYGAKDTYSEAYLQDDKRAFVDEESMYSVTEDRSRIFWQAMQPDNAQMFASETMQQKLLQMCRAIRDAWNLERKTDEYQWEQYLTESIAYKK